MTGRRCICFSPPRGPGIRPDANRLLDRSAQHDKSINLALAAVLETASPDHFAASAWVRTSQEDFSVGRTFSATVNVGGVVTLPITSPSISISAVPKFPGVKDKRYLCKESNRAGPISIFHSAPDQSGDVY